jgi:hypothetical protein
MVLNHLGGTKFSGCNQTGPNFFTDVEPMQVLLHSTKGKTTTKKTRRISIYTRPKKTRADTTEAKDG